jgi:uncharacterized protein
VTHVLVMAKSPVAGRVKTRLCPPCTPAEAAAIAEAARADTLAAVAACRAGRRIVALDGAPGPWLPPGFEVIPQVDGGLDIRLAAAWAAAGGAGVQIGMDTPQVTPALLDGALESLDTTAAALGPTADGGWWAIGLRRPDARVFVGVPMSTPHTGAAQLGRLRLLGLSVSVLPALVDLDTVADLPTVAASGAAIRTAAQARRIGMLPFPEAM